MLLRPRVLQIFLAASVLQALLLLRCSQRWLHVTAAGISEPEQAAQAWG